MIGKCTTISHTHTMQQVTEYDTVSEEIIMRMPIMGSIATSDTNDEGAPPLPLVNRLDTPIAKGIG
jgi:hypothetical protein